MEPPPRVEEIEPVPDPTPPTLFIIDFNQPQFEPVRQYLRKRHRHFWVPNYGRYHGRPATSYQNRKKLVITRIILPEETLADGTRERRSIDFISEEYGMYHFGYRDSYFGHYNFCSDRTREQISEVMVALRSAVDEAGIRLYPDNLDFRRLPYSSSYPQNPKPFLNLHSIGLNYIPAGVNGLAKLVRRLVAYTDDEEFLFFVVVLILGEGIRLHEIEEFILNRFYGDGAKMKWTVWFDVLTQIKKYGEICRCFKDSTISRSQVENFLWRLAHVEIEQISAIVNRSDDDLLGRGGPRRRGYRLWMCQPLDFSERRSRSIYEAPRSRVRSYSARLSHSPSRRRSPPSRRRSRTPLGRASRQYRSRSPVERRSPSPLRRRSSRRGPRSPEKSPVRSAKRERIAHPESLKAGGSKSYHGDTGFRRGTGEPKKRSEDKGGEASKARGKMPRKREYRVEAVSDDYYSSEDQYEDRREASKARGKTPRKRKHREEAVSDDYYSSEDQYEDRREATKRKERKKGH